MKEANPKKRNIKEPKCMYLNSSEIGSPSVDMERRWQEILWMNINKNIVWLSRKHHLNWQRNFNNTFFIQGWKRNPIWLRNVLYLKVYFNHITFNIRNSPLLFIFLSSGSIRKYLTMFSIIKNIQWRNWKKCPDYSLQKPIFFQMKLYEIFS